MNSNNTDYQKQRIKLNFSLQICEKILDDFSNIHYMEVFSFFFLLDLIRNFWKIVIGVVMKNIRRFMMWI